MTTLVIDASNMGHRARYSYSLSNRGRDTSVTYGVLRMTMAAIKEVRPSSVLMCFDGGSPRFRTVACPTYKINRKHGGEEDPTYVEFVRQMNELQRMLPYFGIMAVRRLGIEADDLMYHAAEMLDESVLVTNDDDLLQAVNDKTSVMRSTKNKSNLVTLQNFKEQTGYTPDNFLMAKAIIGDSSDNIPGVKGVGPVLAQKMFEGDAMNINALPHTLVGRVRDFIDKDLYGVLVTISLAYDLAGARYTLINTPWMPYNGKMVYKYCMENAFQSLMEAGSLGGMFGSLRQPEFDPTGLRCPRIWDWKRYPLLLEEAA